MTTEAVKEYGKEGAYETMSLNVNISDKLSKIGEIMTAVSGINGFVVFNGKHYTQDDNTFQKISIPDNGVLILSCGDSVGQPRQWKRFNKYRTDDYYYLESNYPDAITYIPEVDIHFLGFGIFSSYHKKDITYKI